MAKKAPKYEMPTEDQIDQACAWLLTWVKSIDPTFETAIESAKSEHGWTDRQMFGSWCGYVLENDLHMQVSTNPAFEPGAVRWNDGPHDCVMCGSAFTVNFPGQRYCGNDCARMAAELRAAEEQAATTAALAAAQAARQAEEQPEHGFVFRAAPPGSLASGD